MHPLHAVAAVALLAAGLLLPQDKPKQVPTPPDGAKPLPKVLEPARSPVERRDLIQQFQKPHPIEGFYRLKSMTTARGQPVQGGAGYLVVGRRHLSLHLYAPGTSNQAHLQASFRRFEIDGNKLVMKSLLGHRSKDGGDIALEPQGFPTQHEFMVIGSVLRIHRSREEYLEFVRIE